MLGRSAEDAWRTLSRAAELGAPGALGWVFCDDPRISAALRARLDAATDGVEVSPPLRDPSDVQTNLQWLQRDEPGWRGWRWVDVRDGSEDARRAWESLHLRLNSRREPLLRAVGAGLILVAPRAFKAVARESAPDLWSVRSFALDVEPPTRPPLGVVMPPWFGGTRPWPRRAGPAPRLVGPHAELAKLLDAARRAFGEDEFGGCASHAGSALTIAEGLGAGASARASHAHTLLGDAAVCEGGAERARQAYAGARRALASAHGLSAEGHDSHPALATADLSDGALALWVGDVAAGVRSLTRVLDATAQASFPDDASVVRRAALAHLVSGPRVDASAGWLDALQDSVRATRPERWDDPAVAMPWVAAADAEAVAWIAADATSDVALDAVEGLVDACAQARRSTREHRGARRYEAVAWLRQASVMLARERHGEAMTAAERSVARLEAFVRSERTATPDAMAASEPWAVAYAGSGDAEPVPPPSGGSRWDRLLLAGALETLGDAARVARDREQARIAYRRAAGLFARDVRSFALTPAELRVSVGVEGKWAVLENATVRPYILSPALQRAEELHDRIGSSETEDLLLWIRNASGASAGA